MWLYSYRLFLGFWTFSLYNQHVQIQPIMEHKKVRLNVIKCAFNPHPQSLHCYLGMKFLKDECRLSLLRRLFVLTEHTKTHW